MKLSRRLLACILVYLLSIGFLPEFRALAVCNNVPLDQASKTQVGNVDNCGDTSWELKATFGGTLWDEGPLDATGTCTGGWVDCNCDTRAQGFKSPSLTFNILLIETDEQTYVEYQWWWDVKFYLQRDLTPCDSGSGSCSATGYKSESDPSATLGNQGWDDEISGCHF